MHGVGITEEVVQVAEYLLISSYEEYADVVGLLVVERVHRQVVVEVAGGDEVVNFSVGVAGDVLQRGRAVGLLIEPADGHYGEYLVYGPGVGQRLEQREVAEILVGQHLGNLLQLFGGVLYFVAMS